MAKKINRLKGLDQVLAKLNKEIRAIEGRSMKGLLNAGILIRRDMEKTEPLIPVGKTNNLRSGWYTAPFFAGSKPFLELGFTAVYAPIVHEMVDKGSKRINWTRPGSGPKFFEAALNRNHKAILKEIADEAEIP